MSVELPVSSVSCPKKQSNVRVVLGTLLNLQLMSEVRQSLGGEGGTFPLIIQLV